MLLALGAVDVTLNMDAEEFSEMNSKGKRLLRWKGFDSRRRRGTEWKYD